MKEFKTKREQLLISIIVSTLITMEEGIDTANEINEAQASIVEEAIADILDQNMAA